MPRLPDDLELLVRLKIVKAAGSRINTLGKKAVSYLRQAAAIRHGLTDKRGEAITLESIGETHYLDRSYGQPGQAELHGHRVHRGDVAVRQ